MSAACAVCGEPGSLAPYRDIAQAEGWGHQLAHLDCARYRVSTSTFPAFCPRGHRIILSTGACWTMREVEPGLYAYVYHPEPCSATAGVLEGGAENSQRSETP